MADETQEQTAAAAADAPVSFDPATVAALLAQLAGTGAKGGGKAADPPPKVDEKPAGGDGSLDIRQWLSDLERRVVAKETAEKATEEKATKDGLNKKIIQLVKEGDVAKLREALTQFESFYTGQLGERDKRLTEAEGRLSAGALRQQVADATAGVIWAGAAAGRDGLAKLAGLLETVPGPDGSPSVRGKGNGRPAAEVVRDALASDDFRHFLDPGSRGKGGIGKGGAAAPTGRDGGAGPKSLDEDVIARWTARQAEAPKSFGFGAKR